MRIPRIITKTDKESSIGRGCVETGAHYRPEMAAMTHAAVAAAILVDPRISTVRKTEGWRPAKRTPAGLPRRDLHNESRAIDYTFEYPDTSRVSDAVYNSIAFEMYKILGSDYDVVPHSVGSDAIHVHCELDPR